MTVAEQDTLNLPIRWAIYDEDQEPGFYPDLRLDLDAPVPDGKYDVVYPIYQQGKEDPRSDGVTVKDGKFAVEPTTEAIAKIMRPHFRNRDGSLMGKDEQFKDRVIERMDWIGEYFIARIAS